MEEDQANLIWHAYSTEESIVEILNQLTREDGLSAQHVFRADCALALKHMETHSPKCVLLSVDLAVTSSEELRMLAGQCQRLDAKLIILGLPDQTLSYSFLKEQGIDDYLDFPFTVHQIRALIQNALSTEDGPSFRYNTKIVTFMGAFSGVGASTFALNTAVATADVFQKDTVFLDLDLHSGRSGMIFGDQPLMGLYDALVSPGRMDVELYESVRTQLGEHLYGMGDQILLSEDKRVSALDVEQLLCFLYGHVPYIILDCPLYQFPNLHSILRYATDLVLVTDESKYALYQLTRLTPIIMQYLPTQHWHLWCNQPSPHDPDEEVEIDKLVKRLNVSSFLSLPYIDKKIHEAIEDQESFVGAYPNHAASVKLREAVKGILTEDKGESDHSDGLQHKVMSWIKKTVQHQE